MSVLLWPSCIITRLICRSSVSVTSGTRPVIPSACFSASVKAVDLLSVGSWSNSIPHLLVFMLFLPVPNILSPAVWPNRIAISADLCHIRADHLRWIDNTVELLFRYESQLESCLLEGQVVV